MACFGCGANKSAVYAVADPALSGQKMSEPLRAITQDFAPFYTRMDQATNMPQVRHVFQDAGFQKMRTRIVTYLSYMNENNLITSLRSLVNCNVELATYINFHDLLYGYRAELNKMK